MNKAYFAIGLHFHQPIGNFPNVFERAYQNCYKPFLDLLEHYPDMKLTMHFSGCLLDYFDEVHPDFIEKLSVLIKRNQIEIIGGGYYEPILTSIPYKDRIGQIQKMTNYLQKRFNIKPQGLWIPERVWTPDLVTLFKQTKLRYSILDDQHVMKAGVQPDKLYGYYLTKHKGAKFAVFPSIKKLRYDIPFKLPNEAIDYFKKELNDTKFPLFTYGDDGEKFGLWPGTNEWVYKERWLIKFFEELKKNSSFLELVRFSDYLDSNPPLGEIQIPETSYEEMLDWSGGSWNNFLSKYPESNHMHKKMWYVSNKIEQLEKKTKKENVNLLKEAQNELYKGQCNCSYWHGLFGGIYLYHLRKATYDHLINADKIADASIHKEGKNWLNIVKIDFYKNRTKSFIVENDTFSIYIDPLHGGIIRELDYKPMVLNLVNTFNRKKETYHQEIQDLPYMEETNNSVHTIHNGKRAIGAGLKDELFYDRYLKGCLVDHFFSEETNLQDFIDGNYNEMVDFTNSAYSAKKTKQTVILMRKGLINDKPILVSKEIQLKSNKEIEILYTLKNISRSNICNVFGIEFNITTPYANSERYYYFSNGMPSGDLSSTGIVPGADSFEIKDGREELNINFIFSLKPQDIWYFPLRTVSRSESNFELNYQCSSVLPRWLLKINRGKETKFNIKWIVSDNPKGGIYK